MWESTIKKMMKRAPTCLAFFFVCSGCLRASNLNFYYMESYEGLQLEKQGDYVGALAHFKVDLVMVGKLHERYPTWAPDSVAKVLNEYRDKIVVLEPLAAKQIKEKPRNTLASEPPVSIPLSDQLTESAIWKAMNVVEAYLTTLEIQHQQNPQFQTEHFEKQIQQIKSERDSLQGLAIKKAKEREDSQKGAAFQD